MLSQSTVLQFSQTEQQRDPGKDSKEESEKLDIDRRIARYTLWLAVFNGLLVVSTIALWRATRKSTKIAERALTELETPFLSIKVISPGINVKNIKNIMDIDFGVLEFCVANYGRTPASLLEMIDNVSAVPINQVRPLRIDPDVVHGIRMPYGVVAPPKGDSMPFRLGIFESIFGKRRPAGALDCVPTFAGFVRYADIFKSNYVLGFCFIFDPIGNRWVLNGGNDYNYCRKEEKSEEA